MTIEPRRKTPEEEAYVQLLEETWEGLSWPAQALLVVARDFAFGEWMVHNIMYTEEDYDEAEIKMGFVAAGLTDRDQELLARIVSAARTAAGSFDPDDNETVAGFRVHPADIHHWHKMTAERIEGAMKEEDARRRDREKRSRIRRRARTRKAPGR